jgi:hypothetical protein
MAPSEPVLEKPPPPVEFFEVIHNEFPGSTAKMPPFDFPDEPGLHISVGWSSSLSNDFVGNGQTGIIRVRWGKNDGSLHGKKDYRRLMRSQANRPIYAQAGIDYVPGTSHGNVVVDVYESDTGGNNPRIQDTISVRVYRLGRDLMWSGRIRYRCLLLLELAYLHRFLGAPMGRPMG